MFWKTIELFHHFQTLSRKVSSSCRDFRRGCWNCILRVQGNILTKNSFFSNFFFIFGHWAFALTSSRKNSSGVVRTGFSVSLETFGCNSFAKPTICYFLEFRAEIFRLAVRKKSVGLSSCFLPLQRNILRKIILKHFCIFCGLFFRSFPIIEQEKFLPACQNCILCIYKIILKKKHFFGKQMKIFINFRHWAGTFRLLVEFFDGDVRTAFYVSRITF